MIVEGEADLIAQRISLIRRRIHQAATRVGRDPESVRLIAATKSVSIDRMCTAIKAGVLDMGENKLQEALPKVHALSDDREIKWHFIGHLQRNKVKTVLGRFRLIHSVDSLELAQDIHQRAERAGIQQAVLLEVNIGHERNKSGFLSKDLSAALPVLNEMDRLSVQGLMTIPPMTGTAEESRPYFRAVRQLAESLKSSAFPRIRLDELSMGMSQDFEVAVEEGATYIRIGTAIFGARPSVDNPNRTSNL